MQNPFEQPYNNGTGTIIDQAFHNTNALPTNDTMTAMPMPAYNQTQMVPNVMMDMPDDQFQQQNANAGYIAPQQADYASATEQQQAGTYDLNVPPYDIEDPLLRRQFVRKVFAILIMQNLCALPIIEIFILCTSEPINSSVFTSFWLLSFLIFIVMYIFSDFRRYKPVNMITLIFTTLFVGIQAGIYATNAGAIAAYTSQLTMVAQLLFIIAFSKQSRFKFTNLNAILVVLFMSVVLAVTMNITSPHFPHVIEFFIAFGVMYFVYDTYLILSGHHGYNIKADEYIFGAVNIYADIPNLIWRNIRYAFLDPIVRTYKWLAATCFAEVC